MVGWRHRCNGHAFEQAPGVGDGRGGLACCGPRGRGEADTTALLNNDKGPTEQNAWEGGGRPEPNLTFTTGRRDARPDGTDPETGADS